MITCYFWKHFFKPSEIWQCLYHKEKDVAVTDFEKISVSSNGKARMYEGTIIETSAENEELEDDLHSKELKPTEGGVKFW